MGVGDSRKESSNSRLGMGRVASFILVSCFRKKMFQTHRGTGRNAGNVFDGKLERGD